MESVGIDRQCTYDVTMRQVCVTIVVVAKQSALHIVDGRDSSVGIATRYGLDGPGIESRRGRNFPHPTRPSLGHTQPPIHCETGSFQGVKLSGSGVDYASRI
jgi:hypothetical protein